MSGWTFTSWFSSSSSSSSSSSKSSSRHHHNPTRHHHDTYNNTNSSRTRASNSNNSSSGSASSSSKHKDHGGGGNVRKILCRYGMGCTHVTDPVHRERFWHPPIPGSNNTHNNGHDPSTLAHSHTHTHTHAAAEAKSGDMHMFSTERGEGSAAAAGAPFPCHECGLVFDQLPALQLHIQRKTAWSNDSLIGCRVSCLIDQREWQEGLVVEYSPDTGKHRVTFEHMGQSHWMHMLRAAFFIIRRPVPPPPKHDNNKTHNETKDSFTSSSSSTNTHTHTHTLDNMLLAPLEPSWTYTEDISLAYAYAQALMHRAYNWKIQETGHKTQGHLCVTDTDRELAKDAQSSLLYGELLPRGINKALLPLRLQGEEAEVVYELGMGIGKVAMQVFLQFAGGVDGQRDTHTHTHAQAGGSGKLKRVYGVELSLARFQIAEEAAQRLCREHPREYHIKTWSKGEQIVVEHTHTHTTLEMEVGNLLSVKGLETADIILLETDLASTIHPDLCALLRQAKSGARAFTYLDLRKIWCGGEEAGGMFPYRQLEINRPVSDRYATSWSVNRGHHFYLWMKVLESGSDELIVPAGHPEPSEWVPECVILPGAHTGRYSSGVSPLRGGRRGGGEEEGGNGSGGGRMPYEQYYEHAAAITAKEFERRERRRRGLSGLGGGASSSSRGGGSRSVHRGGGGDGEGGGGGGGGGGNRSVFGNWGKAWRKMFVGKNEGSSLSGSVGGSPPPASGAVVVKEGGEEEVVVVTTTTE